MRKNHLYISKESLLSNMFGSDMIQFMTFWLEKPIGKLLIAVIL